MESGQRPPLGDSLVIFELWAQAYRPSSVREKRPVLTTSSWLKSYFGLSVPPDIPKFETVSAFRFMLWGISIIDEKFVYSSPCTALENRSRLDRIFPS